MSNYLAIATVTATLQKILQDTVQADVEGARVTTVRPDSVGRSVPETGVNIFLYRVAPVNWRNADLPGRRSTGEVIKRPQIALDLNYIITFYGNEVELEPQRLLGSVVRTVHSRPVLTKELVQSTVDDSSFRYLRESNLAQQLESVKFMPLSLSTEDLSKIWSVLFQTPYALSLAYQASAVLIESEEIPRRALPVRRASIRVASERPVIDRIISLDPLTKVWHSSPGPILATSSISIEGKQLQGQQTQIRIGEFDLTPQQVSDRKIVVDFSAAPEEFALQPGVKGLQIIHRNLENNTRLIESNVFPFVLLPAIKEIRVDNLESVEELRSAQISILSQTYIGSSQRVSIVLNGINQASPAEYTWKLPPRASDTNTLTATVREIVPGEYLVRLRVDGVESLPNVDLNKNSPTFEQYIGPKIAIA